MSATSDSHRDPDAVRRATQAAVDATATAYTDEAGIDVPARLRAELAEQGLDVDDERWLEEVARRIRSGHDVRVGVPDQPRG